MKPFELFEQQFQSHELIHKHQATLVADARQLLADNPGAEVVGLIFEPASTEAAAFGKALEKATGQRLAGKGFIGVVPRALAIEFLRPGAAASLDVLVPAATDVLPIIAATKGGYRLASTPV